MNDAQLPFYLAYLVGHISPFAAVPSVRTARARAQRSCSEFLYWIKAARLRRAARAGGRGPPPLHVSATAPAAPRHSARNNAETVEGTMKHPDHFEHQDQADEHRTEAASESPRPVGGTGRDVLRQRG